MKTLFLLVAVLCTAMTPNTAPTATAVDYHPGYNAPQFPAGDNIVATDDTAGEASRFPDEPRFVITQTKKPIDWLAFFGGCDQFASNFRVIETKCISLGICIFVVMVAITMLFRRRNSHENSAPNPYGFDRYGWK